MRSKEGAARIGLSSLFWALLWAPLCRSPEPCDSKDRAGTPGTAQGIGRQNACPSFCLGTVLVSLACPLHSLCLVPSVLLKLCHLDGVPQGHLPSSVPRYLRMSQLALSVFTLLYFWLPVGTVLLLQHIRNSSSQILCPKSRVIKR